MSQASPERLANQPTIRPPRLILVDDNIRDRGGHYYELATLLLDGAEQLGYRCILATHRDFDQSRIEGRNWDVRRTFNTRRMVRWSLGVDGHSRLQRDIEGNPIGGGPVQNVIARVSDWMGPAAKRPKQMLHQWSQDMCRLLQDIRPSSRDCILVNTGDDFVMLALANAMKRVKLPPLRIDVLFHFALFDPNQQDLAASIRQLGRQARGALDALRPHEVKMHATTDSLADQLRALESGCPIRSVPYPTRVCEVRESSTDAPLNAVIAGMPRAEKGKDAITGLLSGIADGLLKQGRYRLSMQLPSDRWQSLVPKSLHRNSQEAMPGESTRSLEVITSNLSTTAYHQWLSTADLGLFLYEPNRYVARCSGVLLEMLARGVPVIVPDHCWLANQVRLAGGHRSIGFIYQDRGEIPDLMRQFIKWRSEILPRSKTYATTIAQRHHGQNSLLSMGIEPVERRQTAA